MRLTGLMSDFDWLEFHAAADFAVLIQHDYATEEYVVGLRDNGRPDCRIEGRGATLHDALIAAEIQAGLNRPEPDGREGVV